MEKNIEINKENKTENPEKCPLNDSLPTEGDKLVVSK